MRRRALLVVAGSLLTAGCSEYVPEDVEDEIPDDVLPESETPEPTPPRTGTADGPEQTDTPESSPTETDDGAEQTETPDDETPEETPERTPTEAERRAAEVLDAAREDLDETRDAYLAFADAADATLLDVTAAVDVRISRVTNPARGVSETLADLPDGANDEQVADAARLEALARFFDRGIRCQDALAGAYEAFEFVLGRLYAETRTSLTGNLGTIGEGATEAAGFLDDIDADTDADDTTAYEGLDESTYEDKRTQFEREIEVFEVVADHDTELREGFEAYERASRAFDRENYDEAGEQFETVDDRFRPIADDLSDLGEPPASLETLGGRLARDTDAVAEAATEFVAAIIDTEFGVDLDEEQAEQARETLRGGSDRLQEMDSTQRLLE